jgi:hypothetical protein
MRKVLAGVLGTILILGLLIAGISCIKTPTLTPIPTVLPYKELSITCNPGKGGRKHEKYRQAQDKGI